MVILMKRQDKSLVITKNAKIYQKENAVDALVIYVPQTYEEDEQAIDLSDYTATMYYTTQTNDAFTEILEKQESDKDDYLMYRLPVTTRFTASAGTVTLELAFIQKDEEAEITHVLHSGQLKIQISSWDDYYKFIPEDSLSSIDKRIAILDAETRRLQLETPDDLIIEEDVLHLAKMNEETGELEPMANGVEILIPGDEDHEDSDHDGVIDIDDLPDSASSSSSGIYNFVEL